jgi:hypothetical protein
MRLCNGWREAHAAKWRELPQAGFLDSSVSYLKRLTNVRPYILTGIIINTKISASNKHF